MIFSVIILILVAAIAFFHYVQGLFSATISAALIVLSSLLALSYAEPLVQSYFATGRFVDYAYAVVLVALFAAIYIVLRIIFDQVIPGNVRVPVLMDKIGAAAMGIVAGIFGTGVFAIAAESLPFDVSFGMYSLFPIAETDRTAPVHVPGASRNVDAVMGTELDVSSLEQVDQHSATIIPVADALLGLAEHVSDGGSLAGERALESVHPDLLQELFGQRLGQPVGDKRVTPAEDITVQDVFVLSEKATFRQFSSELPTVRKEEQSERVAASRKRFVVVRVSVNDNAAGAGGFFRFSTGAVELVAGTGAEGESRQWKDYFPIGTLDGGHILFVSHPDDPLFLKPSGGNNMIDFVFEVPSEAVLIEATPAEPSKVRQGTQIVIKRLARLDLSGREIKTTITSNAKVDVLRKPGVLEAAGLAAPVQQ